jgi:hypothetical protein
MIFTTEVIGLECEVSGTFYDGGFDIDWIKHKGEMMDCYAIKDAVLDAVAEEAIRKAAEEALEYDC